MIVFNVSHPQALHNHDTSLTAYFIRLQSLSTSSGRSLRWCRARSNGGLWTRSRINLCRMNGTGSVSMRLRRCSRSDQDPSTRTKSTRHSKAACRTSTNWPNLGKAKKALVSGAEVGLWQKYSQFTFFTPSLPYIALISMFLPTARILPQFLSLFPPRAVWPDSAILHHLGSFWESQALFSNSKEPNVLGSFLGNF